MRTATMAVLAATFTTAAVAQSTRQTVPLDRRNLDTTCAACRDFNQFANGGWMARNPIPKAYSQWGSFNELGDNNLEALHMVLEKVVAERATTTDPAMRKLGAFYASCMDTLKIEHDGAMPIAGELQMISAIASPADIRNYIIRTHARGLNLAFNFGSTQDAKNSSEVITGISQGGLGLPERDYYLKTDSASAALRAAYVTHVANELVLVGTPRATAETDARQILALETAFAQASLTPVEARDPVATYNRKTPAQLAALAPHFDWPGYFSAQHIPGTTAVTVQSPKFLTAVDSLMMVTPISAWQAYFRAHVVGNASPTLSRAFVDENFAFTRTLRGTEEQLPRYKRCIAATDGAMGEALGKAYVEQYFTAAAKARALQMVNNLKAAFRDRLATRPWMSDETRKQAYAKLDAFMDKIGYPDKWRDYTSLDVTPDNSYYQNTIAGLSFYNRFDLNKVGKPVDRTLWDMTPPTVNAYYNPQMNEIVFPAGILQPPFFDPNADDAVNYGGMGAVIGHEMTHGFDDQGAQFDAQGNLRQWFTNADLKNFQDRTGAIVSQFDGYTILDTVHVNGKLTVGENIADFGGLTIAYAAFEKSLEGKPRPANIDGFTPEQRFFLGWAQIFRSNTRPEQARLWVNTDPHSPDAWRVNGPLSNMPEFAKAWGCQAGTPMVRAAAQQSAIW